MGTNYYVIKNKCECCERSDKEYHIGKHSYGWQFSFQGYRWNNLTSWKEYKEFLRNESIEDEYGEAISYEDFVAMVEHTKKTAKYIHNEEGRKKGWFRPDTDWDDDEGYSFTSVDFS